MRYLTLLLLLVASCSPIYIPNTRNTPLFREQGEAQIGGYLTSGGLDAQAAYALTDHIAVIGSYSYGSAKKTEQSVEYTRKNSYGELGLGIFNRTRGARYEIFVGYGVGQGTSYDAYYFFNPPLTQVVATGKMSRFFIQPSIGTNNRNVNVAFTPRFAWVDFSEFNAPPQSAKPNEDPLMFLEPAFTTKFRLAGNLHGFLQLGIDVPIGEPYFEYQTIQAAVGIQIDTGGLRTRVY